MIKKDLSAGYTLLEVLVGLALLVSILVPLLLYMNGPLRNSSEHYITATCLLKQEALKISYNPENFMKKKFVKVNNREWEINGIYDESLSRFTLEASYKNKEYGSLLYSVFK